METNEIKHETAILEPLPQIFKKGSNNLLSAFESIYLYEQIFPHIKFILRLYPSQFTE